MNQVLLLATFLTISCHLILPALGQDVSEESGKRQASHNIMRFGRTASGHNIMRFGRAGHNIMHFGKRGGSSDEAVLADALNEAYNDPDSVDIPALTSLLSTYNYNKKAERDRDNVFMHFG